VRGASGNRRPYLDTATTSAVGLRAGDLAHGVMEGEAEHLDEEVNGVASQIALGPAPVTVFEDETGIGGQTKIVRFAYDELESALLEQWCQRGQPCGTDLFSRPARSSWPRMNASMVSGLKRGSTTE